jgi:hypothetical protein
MVQLDGRRGGSYSYYTGGLLPPPVITVQRPTPTVLCTNEFWQGVVAGLVGTDRDEKGR